MHNGKTGGSPYRDVSTHRTLVKQMDSISYLFLIALIVRALNVEDLFKMIVQYSEFLGTIYERNNANN